MVMGCVYRSVTGFESILISNRISCCQFEEVAVQFIRMCIDLLALLSAAVITNHTRLLARYGFLCGFSTQH